MTDPVGLKRKRRLGIYLNCEPHGGGSFQYCQFILEAMMTLADRHDIVAFYTNELWRDALQPVTCCETYELTGNFYSRMKEIDAQRCDVIVGTDQSNLAEFLRTPYIGVIHDLMHRYESAFPEVSANGEYESRERLYRGTCDFATGIFVDSELGKQQVLESYGRQYADKIYIQPFRVPSYLLGTSSEWQMADKKYIFYPAQFWQHKNHQNLLLAVRQLADEGLRINLVFVGSEKNGSIGVHRLIHLLQLDEQVQCLGYVSNDDICRLYAGARAMVMPTFFGPTNIPPIEAMWLGCPLAVSDIYAMPDETKDAALYFDPKCVSSLANVLRRLWIDDDLCKMLSEHGKARRAMFTPKVFNGRFVENLDKVLQILDEKGKATKSLLERCSTTERIYLYGTGGYCRLVCSFLRSHGIHVSAVLVTCAEENPKQFLGLPVMNCETLPKDDSSSLIILSLNEKYYPEVITLLNKNGLRDYQKIGEDMLEEIRAFSRTAQGRRQEYTDIVSFEDRNEY